MKRAHPLYLFAMRMRSRWFCRGPAGTWGSPNSTVVVGICEGCGSCYVEARGFRAVAWRNDQLPRLLEEMEVAMRTAGAEPEASDLRVMLGSLEVVERGLGPSSP